MSSTSAARRVGFLDPGVLYADLRERLSAEVELVDLSGAGPADLVEGSGSWMWCCTTRGCP